jgi:carbon-monoxide dehydrogenase small subunit
VITELTVNGSPVRLDVDPRRTVADTLRADLGLTGVHLGCEHGVCGMCTVLVDGASARACLLFTATLDGAEVTTVEALGRPDELHPLQRAFRDNHALQCGICTPAFLLSAYELLRETRRWRASTSPPSCPVCSAATPATAASWPPSGPSPPPTPTGSRRRG